jgi:hypothetical protein
MIFQIRWKRCKNAPTKILTKTWQKYAFFHFYSCSSNLFCLSLFVHFLKNFSTIWNQHEILCPIFFVKILDHISAFCKLLKPNMQETAQKIRKKNILQMRSGIQCCAHRRVRLFLQDVEVSVHIWFLELRKGTAIHVMSLILR